MPNETNPELPETVVMYNEEFTLNPHIYDDRPRCSRCDDKAVGFWVVNGLSNAERQGCVTHLPVSGTYYRYVAQIRIRAIPINRSQ